MKPGIIFGILTGVMLIGWVVLLAYQIDVPAEFSDLAKLMAGAQVGVFAGFQRGKKTA